MTYVPPPAGGPAYNAPPQAQPPNRGWIKWVLIGCGVLLLLIIGFVALVGGGIFYGIKKATAEPERVVKSFLAAAGSGDYQAAHDHFSSALKQEQPYDQFAEAAAANQRLFKVKDTTFSNRNMSGDEVQFSGSLELEDGTSVPASFSLIRESNQWKLISYNISP
jgi:hypothetical protein